FNLIIQQLPCEPPQAARRVTTQILQRLRRRRRRADMTHHRNPTQPLGSPALGRATRTQPNLNKLPTVNVALTLRYTLIT
ncbi:MAG: hypothetical protein NZM35_04285, partial [Chitinophagales bacterium]|nr:hypothetical protein [Chitinophagales bacterium]MDW8418420.1 hypothetical protein [Chitinophagales bacterium]